MKHFEKNAKKKLGEKHSDGKKLIFTEDAELRCPRCKATIGTKDQMHAHLLVCGSARTFTWF
ncbi:MAG: hypothetical protein Q4B87_02935 [Candidatus Saccharibacteria bacterium]|nr:hypothetical protein [Candidatus Saccharibacteria bacterium]